MLERLQHLFDLIVTPPDDWFKGKITEAIPETKRVDAIECTSYEDLVHAWDPTYNGKKKPEPGQKRALQWSANIDIAFSAMLAVVASTKQQGSQLWLRVMGPPGTAKSTLCAAIEANKDFVFGMSKMTGFHSGSNFGGSSNSLIPQIRNMTVVVNEGDMLLTAPNLPQILSELRDLYTGKTTAHYKNGQSYEEKGLRVTFILAGTSTLRRLNRSAAGDRFIDVVVYERQVHGGEDIGERDLLKAVFKMAVSRTKNESSEGMETHDTPEKTLALQKTVGFVKYLRETSPQKLAEVEVTRLTEDSCIALAQLTSYMRARPDIKADAEETEVELASRLTEQFQRLAMCLSVVLNRPIDKEILRRVAKIAMDTSKGPSFTLCQALMEKPLDVKGMEARTDMKTDTVRHFKEILRRIGCIKADNNRSLSGATRRTTGVYRLTPQMVSLMNNLYRLLGTKKVAE